MTASGPQREPRSPRLAGAPLAVVTRPEALIGGDGVVASGLTLEGAAARELTIRRFELNDVVLAGSRFDVVGLTDGTLTRCDLANVDWTTVTLERVQLKGCRLTGTDLGDARLHDVSFLDCQLDLAALRFSHVTRARFERCRLDEADFQGARVAASVFADCDLSGARLYQAEFATSVVRDCRFDGLGGLEALRGAELTWPDVIELAPTLAARFGIRIHEAE